MSPFDGNSYSASFLEALVAAMRADAVAQLRADRFGIAARDRLALEAWAARNRAAVQPILRRNPTDALVLKPRDESRAIEVWVRPDYSGYAGALRRALFDAYGDLYDSRGGTVNADHVYPHGAAEKNKLAYVRLMAITAHVNKQRGANENAAAEPAPGQDGIVRGNVLDLCKVCDVAFLCRGESVVAWQDSAMLMVCQLIDTSAGTLGGLGRNASHWMTRAAVAASAIHGRR